MPSKPNRLEVNLKAPRYGTRSKENGPHAQMVLEILGLSKEEYDSIPLPELGTKIENTQTNSTYSYPHKSIQFQGLLIWFEPI